MAQATAMTNTPTGPKGELFGHPRGLFVLFFTEMWERTSYYGMRALLVLYMVQHLFLRPDIGQAVLGFTALKHALETAFGPMTNQALSSQIYGLYTGFVYFTPFFGGLLADRVLGRRKAVIVGGVLMAIGHFLMAAENLFLPALMFLILGNGCFKPNISTQVGGLYAPGDRRRDSAFSIFYIGINIGSFFAPIICGTLGQKVGWHWGFGAAGVGMVLGLLIYVLFQNQLPVEPLPTKSKSAPVQGILAYLVSIPIIIVGLIFLLTVPVAIKYTIAIALFAGIAYWLIRLPSDERPRVIAICVACFIVAAFWAVYEQQGNTLQLWADANTRWPSIGGWQIPSTWYQAFNPFMIWFVTPALTALWAWQATRKQEPSSLQKMGMGLIMLGLGFVIMIVAAKGMGSPDAKRSILWLVSSTLIYTLGELYLSPIGLSFVTKVAPQRIVSMMMGVWFLANFIGNYMTGYLGTFYEKMPKDQFFLMLTSIAVIAGVILLLMSKSLDKVVSAHDRQEA